jgi:hypothetical protein
LPMTANAISTAFIFIFFSPHAFAHAVLQGHNDHPT